MTGSTAQRQSPTDDYQPTMADDAATRNACFPFTRFGIVYMSAFRRLTALSAHLAQSRPLVPSQSFKLGSSYSSPAPSGQMSTEIKELVDKAVKQHKIAIFGKSWCPVSHNRST